MKLPEGIQAEETGKEQSWLLLVYRYKPGSPSAFPRAETVKKIMSDLLNNKMSSAIRSCLLICIRLSLFLLLAIITNAIVGFLYFLLLNITQTLPLNH